MKRLRIKIIGCLTAAFLASGMLTGCAASSDVFSLLLGIDRSADSSAFADDPLTDGAAGSGSSEVFYTDQGDYGSGETSDTYIPDTGLESRNTESNALYEREALDRFGMPVEAAEGLSGFAYDQLDEATKSAYSALVTGIQERRSSFTIRAAGTEAIKSAISAILVDHPEFFWLDGSAEMSGFQAVGIWEVRLGFNVAEEEIDSISRTIEEKTEEYLTTLSENDGDYEKVKKAYEYIIFHTDYAKDSSQNQNIQSVFLNGYSVCAGYARALKYLLDRAGVWCAYVEGSISDSGEGHAWNLVRIDGRYSFVDPSWGDPTYGEDDTDSGKLSIIYDYLCLTTAEIERARHVPTGMYTLPECTDRTDDWYIRNGFYYEGYDSDALSRALWHAVDEGESEVYFKFSDFDTYAAAMAALFPESGEGSLLEAPLQQRMEWDGAGSMQYFYSYSDELLIVKLYW